MDETTIVLEALSLCNAITGSTYTKVEIFADHSGNMLVEQDAGNGHILFTWGADFEHFVTNFGRWLIKTHKEERG